MNLKLNCSLIGLVREKRPVIHCITNYVTAADVANAILACGGSPIMADHPEETAEVTAISDCLLLNMGTPKETSKTAMEKAGREANRLNHPAILDPVGIGVSRYRTQAVLSLLKEVEMTVIRGNASELRIMLNAINGFEDKRENTVPFIRGVDASFSDGIKSETLSAFTETARALSALTGAVIVMTGAMDIISSGEETWLIKNGCPQMSRITGMGCMLDGIIAAFAAASHYNHGADSTRNSVFQAAALATAAAGFCGEQAAKRTEEIRLGTGSFRCCFMDQLSLLDETTLKGGINVEIL